MCLGKILELIINKNTEKSVLPETLEQNHLDETSAISLRIEKTEQYHNEVLDKKFIICSGQKVPIKWEQVVLWSDTNNLKFGSPVALTLPVKNFKIVDNRSPQLFVCHYDVCQTTKMMVDVLKDRGLSVHFGLDSDGTIYQLVDTQNICWHARRS